MGIIIRKALPEDADDYTSCFISSWQSAYKGIVPEDYLNDMPKNKELSEKNKKFLTDPGGCECFCVIHGDKMIGFLTINKADSVNFWAVYLIEAFWGKGYGKIVLDFAINELKRAGQKSVSLWVFEENNRARRFYEKHGFSLDGTKRVIDRYGGVPLVQLKYALDL